MSEALRPTIEAAQRGDRAALNQLASCVDRFVRVFHGHLRPAVRKASGSTIDFVLEGLAEALSNIRSFEYRSDEEFYAWAAKHIRSRIVSAARAEARQKRAGNPMPLDEAEAGVASPDPAASSIVTAAELRDATAQVLVELQVEHPEAMEVVLLHVFEGRSWAEITDALGLSSAKRARTLYAKGLDLLRPRVERRLGKPALWDLLGV